MRKPCLLILLITFSLASVAVAQPPPVSRFSGTTALSQPQGTAFGDSAILTYSFIPDGTNINSDGLNTANDLNSFLTNLVPGGQTGYQALFDSALNRWGSVSGLSFQFEPNDDGAVQAPSVAGISGVRGDIRIGGTRIDGNSGTLAFAFGPSFGELVIDTDDNFYANTTGNNFLGLRNVVAHEIGHAIGLFNTPGGHVESADTRQLLEPFVDLSFDGPQYHDILAVQRAYGDAFESGVGNDTAANATSLGDITNGNPVLLGESAHRSAGNSILFGDQLFEIQPNEVDFISIDDQTDTDVYEFSITQSGSVIAVLDVLGESYQVGAQNMNNEILFDASLRSDLTLELLDSDGIVVLASEDANGFGGDEILNGIDLDAGTYFLRITGVNNPDNIPLGDTQFYGLSIDFTAAIPEPGSTSVFAISALCLICRRRRAARN